MNFELNYWICTLYWFCNAVRASNKLLALDCFLLSPVQNSLPIKPCQATDQPPHWLPISSKILNNLIFVNLFKLYILSPTKITCFTALLKFVAGIMLLLFFRSTNDSWTAFKLSWYWFPEEELGGITYVFYLEVFYCGSDNDVTKPIANFTCNILVTASLSLY